MANHQHKVDSPPALAVALLSLAAGKQDQGALLGDLHEEFGERSRNSLTRARSWYWRQVWASFPPLLRQRMLQNAALSAAAIILISVFSYILITLWDIYAARKFAHFLTHHLTEPPLLMIRCIYFLVLLGGAGTVGALIARSVFSRDNSFRKNAATRLTPTAVLLIAAAVITWVNAGGNYPASYLVLKVGLAISALILGAFALKNRELI